MLKIKKQYLLAAICSNILISSSSALPLHERMEAHTEACKEDMLAIHATLSSTDSDSPTEGIFFPYPYTRYQAASIEVLAKLSAINSKLYRVEHRWFRKQHTCRIQCMVRFPIDVNVGAEYEHAICSWETGAWHTNMRAQSAYSIFARFSVQEAIKNLDKKLFNRLHDEL